MVRKQSGDTFLGKETVFLMRRQLGNSFLVRRQPGGKLHDGETVRRYFSWLGDNQKTIFWMRRESQETVRRYFSWLGDSFLG